MRTPLAVALASVAVGGCFYAPVPLEGLPPPCIAGYVEVDGGCYLRDPQDAGAPLVDAQDGGSDGGVDVDAGCACRDALGECRTGDSIDACGSGGGACEVCCTDGTDACETGRCVPIPARRVAEVRAGDEHTCARLASGEVHCWGANREGQLGNPEPAISSALPVQVGGASDWRSIHGSDASICGIRGGTLRCWGLNSTGQLAQGTTSATTGDVMPGVVTVDTPVPGRTWSDARVGRWHGCGIATDGSVHCWGSNFVDALQQPERRYYTAPAPVAAPTGGGAWDAVRVGLHRTCMLHGGEQWCVGYAGAGRLGVASIAPSGRPHYTAPVHVAPTLSWRELALGSAHSCGITTDDRLHCWGCGAQCAAATCDPMNVDIVDASGGGDPRGLLDCTFALGTALEEGAPYREDPLAGAVGEELFLHVAASDHTCAILRDAQSDVDGAGPLVCFGPNASGQLGDGTTEPHGFSASATVLGDARFSAVSAGSAHSCAVRDTGALYCWGSNVDYRLARQEPTIRDHPSPERVCFP